MARPVRSRPVPSRPVTVTLVPSPIPSGGVPAQCLVILGLTLAVLTACAGTSHPPGTAALGAPEEQKVARPIRDAVAAVLARLRGGAAPADLRAISTELVHVNDAGEIQVYVILIEFRPEYVAQLVTTGLRVELTLPDYRLVQGWIPANLVDRVTGFDFVSEVKPPGYPVPRSG